MRFYDLDIDVKNYAKRIVDAGYKCPADINSVSDFVKGLKTYNLYDTLIDFYLLAGDQNAGSGSTVFSFKGNYNGTMINSPLWSPSYMIFNNASNPYINHLPFPLYDSPNFTILGVGKTLITGKGSWWNQSSDDGGDRTIWFAPNGFYALCEYQYGQFAPNFYYQGTRSALVSQGFRFISYTVENNFTNSTASLKVYDNGSIIGTTNVSNFTQNSMPISRIVYASRVTSINGFNGDGGNNLLHFLGAYKRPFTASEQVNYYSIIKSTIGKRLNLV
jgi:hypothetical protein